MSFWVREDGKCVQFLALGDLTLGEIHCFSQGQAISMKASEKTAIATVSLMGNVFGTVQCPQAWQRLTIFETTFVNKKAESNEEKGKVVPTAHTVIGHNFPLLHENCQAKPMSVVFVHWEEQSLESKGVNIFCVLLGSFVAVAIFFKEQREDVRVKKKIGFTSTSLCLSPLPLTKCPKPKINQRTVEPF